MKTMPLNSYDAEVSWRQHAEKVKKIRENTEVTAVSISDRLRLHVAAMFSCRSNFPLLCNSYLIGAVASAPEVI